MSREELKTIRLQRVRGDMVKVLLKPQIHRAAQTAIEVCSRKRRKSNIKI